MTQQELIELVQQHHLEMGETEIRKLLNRTQDNICRKTEILKGHTTDTTVADQRFYDLDSTVLDILEVTITDSDGNMHNIPRTVVKPSINDDA